MRRWLASDLGLAVTLVVYTALVSLAIVLSAIAYTQANRVAHPTNREVVERLQRAVHSVSQSEARELIREMLRRAGRP